MNFRRITICLQIATIALLVVMASHAFAQSATPGALHGQVLDPSNAAVTGATVLLTDAAGHSTGATTNQQGAFDLKNLAPGKYSLEVVAKGFALYKNENLQITPDQTNNLNVLLAIEEQEQQVTVTDQPAMVDVSPQNNAGAIIISGAALDALPDDPDELQTDLTALAGPSAGPNGGQFYIDGFTAGQLPPKSAIREIRINQNPFSAQYDKVGYGRIEIFTKPRSEKWHGQISVNGNDSAFNSTDPFAGAEPNYYTIQYEGSLGGPINKKSSVFISSQRSNINDLSAIHAITLDPNDINSAIPFTEAVPN